MTAAGARAYRPEEMTVQEFQRFARTHDGLWELYEGIPVKMDSPGRNHQRIAVKLIRAFGEYFDNRTCEALPEMDVWAKPEPLEQSRTRHTVLKPDLLVYCSEEQYRNRLIHSPQLVVEIWSPSNTLRERAEKQAVYQTIGVRELWLIDSETQEFLILGFEQKNAVYISGGNLTEDEIKSQYFPGLTVSRETRP